MERERNGKRTARLEPHVVSQLFPYQQITIASCGHGKTRRAPLDQAKAWHARYDEIGHFFTGHITERPPRHVIIIDDETRDAFRFPR